MSLSQRSNALSEQLRNPDAVKSLVKVFMEDIKSRWVNNPFDDLAPQGDEDFIAKNEKLRAKLLRQIGIPYDARTMGPPNQSNTLTFKEPRGMAVNKLDTCGDIFICDEARHCVICVNSVGVFKWVSPRPRVTKVAGGPEPTKLQLATPTYPTSEGSGRGQYSSPRDLCLLPNGWLAVADFGNRRVQVMRGHGNVRFMFETKQKPIALACDDKFTIFVLNEMGEIEVYIKSGKYSHSVSIIPKRIKLSKARMTLISDAGFELHDRNLHRRWLIISCCTREADLVFVEVDSKNQAWVSWKGQSTLLMSDIVACQAVSVENEDIDDMHDDCFTSSSSSSPTMSGKSSPSKHSPRPGFSAKLRHTQRFRIFKDGVKGISFLLGDSLNHCVYRCWVNITLGCPVFRQAVKLIAAKDSLGCVQNLVKLPGNRIGIIVYALRASEMNKTISRMKIFKLPEK